MNEFLKHIGRLVLFVLAQGLLFGQLEFGYGIHPMIYPMFILLLPFDMRPIALMFTAFVTGIGVDFFMNTFGLHASAAVLVAYFRPELYRLFSPRDGYDMLKEPTLAEWGVSWYFKVAGITVFIHHLWFFTLEYFSFSSWTIVLRNTLTSGVVSLLICFAIQVLFLKKPKRI